MHKLRSLLPAALALVSLASLPAQSSEHRCASLVHFTLPGFTLAGVDAKPISAGPFVPDPSNPAHAIDLPAHCVFRAEIDPRTGVDGKHYGIGFELRLPDAWNGKFFFQGGGGLDGLVRPAIGGMPNPSTSAVALARGYAVASTDAGHEGATNGNDGSFGADQQARIDSYYAAIERVTRLVRQLLPVYYTAPLQRAYFVGCSNGGRQALLAAQRFPLLFDGVVAGDPAFNLTNAAIAEMWDDQAFLRAAPNDAESHPILAKSFSDADLKLLGTSVLAQCDKLDGASDGLIENPEACHYDPAVLTCKGGKTDTCLTAAQVTALHTAFSGPHTSAGQPLYSSWPYDSGLADPGWRVWKLGSSDTAEPDALNMTLGLDAMRGIQTDTYQPSLDVAAFNFDTAAAHSINAAAAENATSTLYSSFAGHGGKLLLFTGMSDPIFSATDLVRYLRQLQADNGGEPATSNWAQLYLIPGMTHCGGGPSLDDFDPLTALDTWVETGTAPTAIRAKGTAFPNRARDLCPYPAYPHYRGTGSLDDPSSFTCKRD